MNLWCLYYQLEILPELGWMADYDLKGYELLEGLRVLFCS